MAEGCTERLHTLPGFLWFILRTARGSRRKQARLIAETHLPKHRLRSAAKVDRFVTGLG